MLFRSEKCSGLECNLCKFFERTKTFYGPIFVTPEKPQISEDHIRSFEDCVAAGNPVMESYPRQCRTEGGKHFVEEIIVEEEPEIETTEETGVITPINCSVASIKFSNVTYNHTSKRMNITFVNNGKSDLMDFTAIVNHTNFTESKKIDLRILRPEKSGIFDFLNVNDTFTTVRVTTGCFGVFDLIERKSVTEFQNVTNSSE